MLLYDIYHQQITEGNLISTIRENISTIGHFHAADVPGRHEPGTGDINYKKVFAAISDLNYDGSVGFFTLERELDTLVEAVKDICRR